MRTGDLHVDHAVDVGEIEDGEVRLESSTSREQLVALLDRYERPLYSFLSVLLADRAAAEDCVQDTFLRAYEHLQRRRGVTGTWLYRVARNRAVDELRRRGRVQSHDAEGEIATGEVHAGDVGLRALALLSAEDRELLYLFDVDGFSAREIGDMLGIKPGAVYVRIFRARERFRVHYRAGGGRS
jgi:RNA polymerase sigma-70 factor (ECF subfamily)